MLSQQPPGVPNCSELPSQARMINESLRDPSDNEQLPSLTAPPALYKLE